MNKKILLSLGMATLLVTSLNAYDGKCSENRDGCSKKNTMMQKHKTSPMMRMFRDLDLTQEQKDAMRKIVHENRKNRVRISEAFTSSEFNKEKFIEIEATKKHNRIRNRAEMIAQMYALLTPAQKKELKSQLDTPRMQRASRD